MATTNEGKWVIYEVATGKRLERWSVDARDMIATGDYTTQPPRGAAPEPEPEPKVVKSEQDPEVENAALAAERASKEKAAKSQKGKG